MSHWENSIGESSEWYTPPHVFDALGCRFDMDVAAPADRSHVHVPADRFLSKDGLTEPWDGFVWMNPPFGGRNGIAPWLERFIAHGDGVALTPDRTSAPWFWQAWAGVELGLFTRKIRFLRPDGTEGTAPSNGTALMSIGERGHVALRRAMSRGLGILAAPDPRQHGR